MSQMRGIVWIDYSEELTWDYTDNEKTMARYLTIVQYLAWVTLHLYANKHLEIEEHNRLVDMLTSEDVENVRVAEEILRLEVQKFNQKIVSHEKTIQLDLSEEEEEGPTQEV